VSKFHVAAGKKLHADKQFIWRPYTEYHKASKHHLLKFGFLLLVRLNLGFTTEERLAAVLILPSLGVPNWSVIYINTAPSTSFLAPLPRRKKTSARGVSHAQSFILFLFCFILFLLASFYQKCKKISCYFITLSSLCCSLSMFWRTSQ
jgi:hypothetical protein